MRLFHFSDDPAITRFEPRPVLTPSPRAAGREWLNGPLVWAIDEWHQPMYLFPRDCPRILVWPKPESVAVDLETWWQDRTCRMVAYIEQRWLGALRSARLHRYEFASADLEDLNDAGMGVAFRSHASSSGRDPQPPRCLGGRGRGTAGGGIFRTPARCLVDDTPCQRDKAAQCGRVAKLAHSSSRRSTRG